MRTTLAAVPVAFLISLSAAPAARAAKTEVEVRIEGAAETLFEGPILSEPRGVRAASDPIAPRLRRCDGIDELDPANAVPALTPTAAGAGAMAEIGEGFDGRWYPGYEDYFVTRWGPDAQGGGAFWGALVNEAFSPVGGCQYQLGDGDEVLWIYDAFGGRPTLALLPEEAGYVSGPRPLTATAQLGVPFPLEVLSYADEEESVPPATPSRLGSSAFAGAKVAPVLTGPAGFEKVDTGNAMATTGPGGRASIEFSTPGWHRIKATVGTPGGESTIRSNRLDICVPGPGGAALEGAVECDELPAADRVREPPPAVGEIEAPQPRSQRTPAAATGSNPPAAAGPDGRIRVSTPRLDRRHIDRGRLGVSWRILAPGPGVGSWTISSRTLGRRGARFLTRATGTRATAATIRLPRGSSYRIRFTIADTLGRSSSVDLGKVTVPRVRAR